MHRINVIICWIAVILIAAGLIVHALDDRVPSWVQTAGPWLAYIGAGFAVCLILLSMFEWCFNRLRERAEDPTDSAGA